MKAGKSFRPFSETAKIYCKAYSTPLQRAVVDLGSEVSFVEAARLLKEHYGIDDIPTSSIRKITEYHADIINKNLSKIQRKRQINSTKQIIMQIDGGMVPIVETQNAQDRRKTRKVSWSENKLSLAYAQGTITPIYASTMEGVDVVGNQLVNIANLVGRDNESHIHCVSDGAPWIANQTEAKFGNQANFLIDFYHLSEYLHKASICCFPKNSTSWASIQKLRMKEGKMNEVIQELERHINEDKKPENHVCEAEACFNYMIKRSQQFNYKEAIAKDLPIGSGKIESGHRSVIQKRLKLSGAWWLKKNANAMGSLRVLKANGYFNDYWTIHRMSELSCIH